MRYARDERQALCGLLDRLGPGEPTLCEGWRTADLAAHLVLRERRIDAGLGMLGGPLAARTRRLQDRLGQQNSFAQLVTMIRTGPPRWSVFSIPGADERANTTEYFVHHEDVRRAQPGWQPREISQDLSELLWRRLRLARLLLRKAPVGVVFARTDEPGVPPGGGQAAAEPGAGRAQAPSLRLTVSARAPVVTVTGTPAELTMWAMGRTAAARVQLEGGQADVRALTAARWRV